MRAFVFLIYSRVHSARLCEAHSLPDEHMLSKGRILAPSVPRDALAKGRFFSRLVN